MSVNPLTSVTSLVGALVNYPVLSSVLFVVLFSGLVVLLAGRRAAKFLIGLLRALASCFYSPILWLRKAILSTADFASRGEIEDTRSDQYLLNRILTIVRAGLIVLAVGGLAAGLATSGTGLIPSQGIRQRLSALRGELKQQDAALREAERAQMDVEKHWDAVRAARVKEYRDAAGIRLSTARSRMEDHARALQDERWFGDIQDELAGVRTEDGPARFAEAAAAAQRRVRSLWIYGAGIREHAFDYIGAWYERKTAEHQTQVVPEEQIKQELLAPLAETTTQARAQVDQTRAEIGSERAIVTAQMTRAVLGAVGSLLGFLGTLWLVGLFVEWVWLFIHLADNVRALRERGN